jgi:hypothetical protein
MRTAAALGALLALAVPAARGQGNASPYEDVVKQMVAGVDQMTKVLGTVTDSATAGTAQPGLKKAVDDFVAIRRKAEELRQPEEAEKERVRALYEKKMKQSLTRFLQETSRVRTVAGGRDLLRELDALKERTEDAPSEKKK